MSSPARRIPAWLGVDRAVGMTLLGRLWLIGSAPVTLVLIARTLTSVEQGFYYTFSSMLAMQVFFELGLSTVLMQYVSHQRADEGAAARIGSALDQAVRWYALVAALVIAAIIPAGIVFFAATARGTVVDWRLPWALLVVLTALNLMTVPFASVLQGLGQVAEVAQMRLHQSIGQTLTLWAALLFGARLYTPAIASAVSAALALALAFGRMGSRLRAVRAARDPHVHISWKEEIWPLQWRIAVSSVCGFLTFQIFNPVVFASRGAAEAGRLGMSLAIANAISSVATAWVTTRAPEYGELVARRAWTALDSDFRRHARQSVLVAAAGLAVLAGGVLLLRAAGHPFAERVVDPLTFLLVAAATLVSVHLFALSVFLRAHRQDPFMLLTVVNAVAMVASTLFLGPRFGARGVMAGYLLTNVVFGLVPGTLIFLRKRREYREPSAV